MKPIKRTLLSWLPFAVCITLILAGIYIVIQQQLRQSANDPQIQIAKDTVFALEHGAKPDVFVAGTSIPLETSIAPFVIVYDDTGKPIVGSGNIKGVLPIPPSGVFEYTKTHGENRITWEPTVGIREAIIVLPFTAEKVSGYVLAGRSLSETENREAKALEQILLVWISVLIGTFIAVWIKEKYYVLR